jgi:outer membrane lipoprotein
MGELKATPGAIVRRRKKMDRVNRLWLLLSLCIFLAGCGYPISQNLRTQANLTPTFQEVFQNPEASKGKIVIWGGEIIQTMNQKDKSTLIEVLQRPLDWREEPKENEPSGGRFLILVENFLDPYIYRQGREITVAGEILGERVRPLGETEYRYPFLLSKQIYLWKEYRYLSPAYDRYSPWWYYDPWGYYGPWGRGNPYY